MNTRQWQLLLLRDGGYCPHCGETEALAPNHRANRGMGGCKAAETPSNYVLLCSYMNERIEGNTYHRELALENGWKVSKWDNPKKVPVFDACTGIWYYLNDDWTRTVAEEGINAAS